VLAPMAGGISNPALTAAVSAAGGLGFVAAGYRSPDQLRDEIVATRALTDEPFGVNLFMPGAAPADAGAVAAYAALIAPMAQAAETRRHAGRRARSTPAISTAPRAASSPTL